MFSRTKSFNIRPVLRTMYGALLAFALNSGFTVDAAAKPSHSPFKGWEKIDSYETSIVTPPADEDQRPSKSIEDLLNERLERERSLINTVVAPEHIRIEANYIRTAGAGETVLHESSFHLEPRYRAFSAEGRDSLTSIRSDRSPQPVMFFIGYTRTPLALPVVSNLSEALKGDEAAYTLQLGILPLPKPAGSRTDSVRLYVIIERAIESNRSISMVNIERYAKEFTVLEGEPVQLRLENAPPERRAYIVKLEDNSILDFYEDFARHFSEHIWINSDRLHFALGKAEISPVTSRLSIPYTVEKAAHVEVELLSVIDSVPALTIIDTVRDPADYLAETDMKPMANGPYRYRFIARDLLSDQVLFTETRDFVKRSPITIPPPSRIAPPDTLQIGGKREDLRTLLAEVHRKLAVKEIEADRLGQTAEERTRERDELARIMKARESASIAGLRGHAGLGFFGSSAGTHAFIGIESKEPMLSLDVSFGFLGDKPPFLSSTKGGNLTKIFETPKSLGIQLSYVVTKALSYWAEPMIGFGYYGIWSTTAQSGGLRSATLLSPYVGIYGEPFGEAGKYGYTFTTGPIFGLGLDEETEWDFTLRFYTRF